MNFLYVDAVTVPTTVYRETQSVPLNARPVAVRRDAVTTRAETRVQRRRECLETDGPATCLVYF